MFFSLDIVDAVLRFELKFSDCVILSKYESLHALPLTAKLAQTSFCVHAINIKKKQ